MTERFVEQEPGTLLDRETGLMWQTGYAYSETGNYLNWYEARDYVARLNARRLGGHADWRLPDKLELQSLYLMGRTFESRGRRFELHIDPAFEFGYGSCFWTWRERLSGAIGFSFDQGEARWYPKAGAFATARAVRLNLNPFNLLRCGKETGRGGSP